MNDRFNLAHHVLFSNAAPDDRIALAIVGLSGAERWSYGRLRAAVSGTATGLLDSGLTPGDRVLMRLGNSADFPIAYLGAIAAGLVPVPTSAQLTATEASKLARIVSPAAILSAPDVALPDHAAQIIDSRTLRGFRDLPAAVPVMGDAERPAYIVFTSGTSGVPRAVVHAHRAILARRMMIDGWYGLTAQDRMMHAGAFNWTYTLGTGLMDPWTVGATALIPEPGLEPRHLPLLLKRHEASIFAAAPGVYRQLLRSERDLALPALRHGLSAGEKLPDATRSQWISRTGTPIHEAYGMSECSTFISGSPERPAPDGTLGYPQPGRRIAIRDDGIEQPPGRAGTIAVHRSDPGLMLGYLDEPDETAARYDGDWFLTGDMGAADEDGAIRYLGRDDDMMNAGGFRVSPIEVEAALMTHPAVTDACVIERAVSDTTSIIAAYWCGPDDIASDVLAAHCARLLARYKQPRSFTRLDTLPRGANGKLIRRQLREQSKGTT